VPSEDVGTEHDPNARLDSHFAAIEPLRTPEGAPNILLVMIDDAGYGASSTFGGPCQTPTLERLAANGLRHTKFHTTALCSPPMSVAVRAALIEAASRKAAAAVRKAAAAVRAEADELAADEPDRAKAMPVLRDIETLPSANVYAQT
jgi:hypothetical protein